LEFGQEIVRNFGVKRHVAGLDVPLGSGVEILDDSQPAAQVIFRASEVHELE
jgi:hypothetical protein